jgi:carbon-monoxide dehydrogenase medium subunit
VKPPPFVYHRPARVADALTVVRDHPGASLLAGGQSLLTLMNLRLARPAHVVDIGGLDELRRVFHDVDGIVLGALVTHRTLETDPVLTRRLPLAAAAAAHIGHVGIRNRGTLGGTLAHADPAAELPMVMAVLDAQVHVESATGGRRVIPAAELCVSYFTNALEPGEMVTWVRVPEQPAHQGWGFAEIAHRHGDYGLAGAAVTLELDAAGRISRFRAGLLAAGDTPVLLPPDLAPIGVRPETAVFDATVRDWTATLSPPAENPDHARLLAAAALDDAIVQARSRCAGSPIPEDVR